MNKDTGFIAPFLEVVEDTSSVGIVSDARDDFRTFCTGQFACLFQAYREDVPFSHRLGAFCRVIIGKSEDLHAGIRCSIGNDLAI